MENLLLISLALLVASVFVASLYIVRKLRKPVLEDTKSIKEGWKEIEELIKSDSVLSWKMAIIEADKLMDSALKQAKMRGDTMGERLRFATYEYPKIRSVWKAHILRNDIVHEKDRKITRGEAQKALILFRQGLKILKVL